MNPKDRIGSKKVGTSVVPPASVFVLAQSLMDGARKYGPFNWREEPVQASIYLEAIDRHKALWSAGDEKADDSLVHHLGHIMGCCAILIDAQLHGTLIDDRNKSPEFVRFLKEANQWALERSNITITVAGNKPCIDNGVRARQRDFDVMTGSNRLYGFDDVPSA